MRLLTGVACMFVWCAFTLAEGPDPEAKTVARWIDQLESDSVPQQLEALKALNELAPTDRSKKGLIKLLGADNEALRAGAAIALTRLGPLESDDRARVIVILEQVFTEAGVLPQIANRDDPKAVRDLSERLVAQLDADDDRVRAGSAWALLLIDRHADEATRTLFSLWDSGDPKARKIAASTAQSLVEMQSTAAMPVILEAIKRDELSFWTHRALSEMGPVSLPGLIDAFERANREMRLRIAYQLGYVGPEVTPFLVTLLGKGEKDIRAAAASAFSNVTDDNGRACKIFIGLLRDGDKEIARAAASSLGKCETHLKLVAPALAAALQDNNSSLRDAAAHSLGRLSLDSNAVSVSILTAAFNATESQSTKRRVLQALAKRGKEAETAVPALIEALSDPTVFSGEVAKAIGKIGGMPNKAVPALLRSRVFCHTQAEAISGFGADAVPYLIQTVEVACRAEQHRKGNHVTGEENLAFNQATVAVWALERIGVDARAAIPALKEAHHINFPHIRASAAKALPEIDPTGYWKNGSWVRGAGQEDAAHPRATKRVESTR